MIEVKRFKIEPGPYVPVSENHTDVLVSMGAQVRGRYRVAIAPQAPTGDGGDFITLWERTDPLTLTGIPAGSKVWVSAYEPGVVEVLRGTADT